MSTVPFGRSLKEHFHFDPDWRNLNHGSYGTVPIAVKKKQLDYQRLSEAAPDKFIRYGYEAPLTASREALAKLLNVSIETIVLAANATTAANIILRNLSWSPDKKDEIISFSTVYGGCGKTIQYLIDSTGLFANRVVDITYPIEDDEIVQRFRSAVEASRADGKNPKVAIFDVVSSQPGVLFPFEAVTKACRELGVLSLVDGAQGIGMVHLDLGTLDADFFLSNCHKWLLTPRGCAVLYVPLRNQHLMPSTLPTSHGYIPLSQRAQADGSEGAAPASYFVDNFTATTSLDRSSFLCVSHALEWRQAVLGGEEQIRKYNMNLAKEGGRKAAEILGTRVLDNDKGTLTNCSMVNVWLPIAQDIGGKPKGFASDLVLPQAELNRAIEWASKVLVDEYQTFVPIGIYDGQLIVRISAQVYLDIEDFEWAGRVLREICTRIKAGEYKQ